MRAAKTIGSPGQKFRTRSEKMTGSVVATGWLASGLGFLTADRYSYFRYPKAGLYRPRHLPAKAGLAGSRTHTGPTITSHLGQRCYGRWSPQRRGPKGPRLSPFDGGQES